MSQQRNDGCSCPNTKIYRVEITLAQTVQGKNERQILFMENLLLLEGSRSVINFQLALN
jgi:hypothetical protein